MSINSFRFLESCLVLSLEHYKTFLYSIQSISSNEISFGTVLHLRTRVFNCQVYSILESSLKFFSKFSSQNYIHHLIHSEPFQNHHLEHILTSLHSISIDFNILNQLFTWFITGFILFPICQTHMNNISKSLFNMSFTY